MGALAVLTPAAGVALLRGAWQLPRGHRLRLPADLAGWALIAAGIGLWMTVGGPDRGLVIAVLVFMLAGLAWVAVAGWRNRRVGARPRRRGSRLNGDRTAAEIDRPKHRAPGRVWVFLLAGPIAGAGSFATGLALQLLLLASGWHPANALAAMLLWVPLAWTALAVVATTHFRLAGRTAVVCGATLAGVVTAFALPGVAA